MNPFYCYCARVQDLVSVRISLATSSFGPNRANRREEGQQQLQQVGGRGANTDNNTMLDSSRWPTRSNSKKVKTSALSDEELRRRVFGMFTSNNTDM
jgi:hypothetical protein